ncbi:MAG: peptide chain release factor 1 eRF1 [Terrestrivirus sp.]|uniref:Peptide chain release factor 1 eRF1 n=1 Tax=Terrestrivirus sp. TaxID=2487775 RepID=A0A3G4ZM87_9VIRU|nr:MAG: peptide chain release factor 1 eRF1 [Terrestrivirus sp.]
MYNDSVNYGIILLSGKDFRCYVLEITGSNKEFKLIDSDKFKLQKRQKKGGQSAQRIDRLREIQRGHYITEINEIIQQIYMRENNTMYIVKGFVIGGVGDFKHEVINNDIFQQYFSSKILRIVSTEEINDGTVYDVYNKCIDILGSFDINNVNKIINEIKILITNADDKLIFGKDDIMNELKSYQLKKLIISDQLFDTYKNDITQIIYDYELHIVPHNMIEIYGGILGIKYY